MTTETQELYLKKRDIILKTLSSLIGQWDLAEWIFALVSSVYVTPEVIDGIEKILADAIAEWKDAVEKNKLQASLDVLKNMKEIESLEREAEKKLIAMDALEKWLFL